ncbi:tRNA intron endonuclease [Trypanosoma melophagium]|uniref:tRNA intron endonuclease n=1 Tax=Trypanosoma melophagium TaxID=715481 RepID=UPI00351A558A|nr:tRNA intron endonuclease [Trypanosoma melophagium]
MEMQNIDVDKALQDKNKIKVEGDRPIVRIIGTHGPLFISEDPSLFLKVLPQVHKKNYGDTHLSIEELEYLNQSFTIIFVSDEYKRFRDVLYNRHTLSCEAYCYLTDVMKLHLRHGSQFGAAFIGYKDINGHGECLIFFGPLSHLETVAAARVACSVGKEAWVLLEEGKDQHCYNENNKNDHNNNENNNTSRSGSSIASGGGFSILKLGKSRRGRQISRKE